METVEETRQIEITPAELHEQPKKRGPRKKKEAVLDLTTADTTEPTEPTEKTVEPPSKEVKITHDRDAFNALEYELLADGIGATTLVFSANVAGDYGSTLRRHRALISLLQRRPELSVRYETPSESIVRDAAARGLRLSN